MGIRKQGKKAYALVILLIIIVTITVMLAGTIKLITGTNSKYSINRNAKDGNAGKVSGRYICYKERDGNDGFVLKQKRIEYSTDGSVTLSDLAGDVVDECKFVVPQGFNVFNVTLVGGGAQGSTSSVGLAKDTINCNGDDEDIKECKTLPAEIFKNENNNYSKNLRYNLYTTKIVNTDEGPESQNVECFLGGVNFPGNTTLDELKNDDKRTYYIYQQNGVYNCSTEKPNDVEYETSQSGEGLTREILVQVKGKNGNTDTILFEKEFDDLDEAVNYINSDNFGWQQGVAFTIYKYKFNVKIGQPGEPGQVLVHKIQTNITNEKGGAEIIIKPEDIGEPVTNESVSHGATPSYKDGITTFTYYHKNSKDNQYTKVTKQTGTIQKDAGYSEITYYDSSSVKSIYSQQGITPEDFILPSDFGFNLSPGYIKGDMKSAATYFGASGASGGDIMLINDKDLLDNCKSIQYDNKRKIYYGNCNLTDPSQTKFGSEGAPGAIMITW